ncbi:hypothetical protein A1E_04075 [Rickettsia canadensis str. McKiel]|uniref:Uncharacterized protein n=1 Tax=Rickettsia canadensis (strain McKiel) TaxID=293613 RepID=A8EZF9_RICCK|nr:hypothetical protein A1E_04075 [Rickettsia canadensis str. McKiel]
MVDTIIENFLAPIGILINDTGVGMSITANCSSEIRATLCNDI